MNEPELVSDVMMRSLIATNSDLYRKVLRQEIFRRWDEVIGKISDKIIPVKIDGDVLIVDSDDNAVKDFVKYAAQDLVDRINDKVGRGAVIINKIKFGKSFGVAAVNDVNVKTEIVDFDIELTDDELVNCERRAAVISDLEQRQVVFETLINRIKSDKWRLRNGWHKCKLCNSLCKPKEIICDICKVKERDKMHMAIRHIFKTAPATPFQEIQREILKLFPHLATECTLQAIESARMELILRIASTVSYGDKTSDRAIFLVMLARQLPAEKLTPAIINRTLKEYRFNLADQPPFSEHEFSKLPQGHSRRIPK